jgi:hypothetical protein
VILQRHESKYEKNEFISNLDIGRVGAYFANTRSAFPPSDRCNHRSCYNKTLEIDNKKNSSAENRFLLRCAFTFRSSLGHKSVTPAIGLFAPISYFRNMGFVLGLCGDIEI